MTTTRKTGKNTRHSRRRPASEITEPTTVGKGSKLDMIVARLTRPEGASLGDLMAATGWQAHSVRGALAGSLKKKGHAIVSEKIEGERRDRIGETG